jgi:hypothetical protein
MNIYENLLVYNSKVFLLFIVQSTDGQTNTLIGKTKKVQQKKFTSLFLHFSLTSLSYLVPSTSLRPSLPRDSGSCLKFCKY